MPSRARRARVGTLLMFFVNGATFASLVPRYPEIKAHVGADATTWGLAVGLGPLGGLALGLTASRLIARFGSRTVAVWPQLVSTACLLLMANANHVAWIFVAMLTSSAFDAVTDIAMNYQGLRVQELYRRSILNTFHGWWSIGAVIGGLLGASLAQAGVNINLQACLTLVVLAAVAWLSWSLMLTGRADLPQTDTTGDQEARETIDPDPSSPHGPTARAWMHAVALGILGALAGGIEVGGSSWAPLYMDSAFTTTPFIAGLGFVGLMAFETLGRLAGDVLVDRFGQPATVAQGAVVCLVAMTVSIVWPTPATAVIGFSAAGWGVATTIPAAMHVADSLPRLRPGTGLTVATWVMRLGFMGFPIAIGALGDAVSLRWALVSLPVGALAMLLLVPCLRISRTSPTVGAPGVLD